MIGISVRSRSREMVIKLHKSSKVYMLTFVLWPICFLSFFSLISPWYICRETLVQDVYAVRMYGLLTNFTYLKTWGYKVHSTLVSLNFLIFKKQTKKIQKTKINKWKKTKIYIFNCFFANNFSIVFVKQEVTSLCKDLYHFTRTKKI